MDADHDTEDILEKARLRRSAILAAGFTLLLWISKGVEIAVGIDFSAWGINPAQFFPLPGILLSPLIHGGIRHLFANSIPILVLGTSLFYLYPTSAWRVFSIVYLLGGLGVWLFARPVYHIGASGLIYGFIAFLFFSGVIRREVRSIALALIVVFLYGGAIWGVLPLESGVSWEGHLFGALAGTLCAFLLRNRDREVMDTPDDGKEEDF